MFFLFLFHHHLLLLLLLLLLPLGFSFLFLFFPPPSFLCTHLVPFLLLLLLLTSPHFIRHMYKSSLNYVKIVSFSLTFSFLAATWDVCTFPSPPPSLPPSLPSRFPPNAFNIHSTPPSLRPSVPLSNRHIPPTASPPREKSRPWPCRPISCPNARTAAPRATSHRRGAPSCQKKGRKEGGREGGLV